MLSYWHTCVVSVSGIELEAGDRHSTLLQKNTTIVLVTEVVNKLQTTLSQDWRGVRQQTKAVDWTAFSGEQGDFVSSVPGVISGKWEGIQGRAISKEWFLITKIATKPFFTRHQVKLKKNQQAVLQEHSMLPRNHPRIKKKVPVEVELSEKNWEPRPKISSQARPKKTLQGNCHNFWSVRS